MGSGKSTVGRLLARRLGYRFVDVDERIESRAGMSIREIFAAEGEEAFRRLESETLEDLAGEERIVAAAGGGAPVPVRNREFFAGAAASFYLEVSFEEFLRRTGSDPARPLLQRGTGELRSLYEQRRPVYESLGRRIPTEGRTPEEIVEEILRVLGRSR
jgi:shikimate kinase